MHELHNKNEPNGSLRDTQFVALEGFGQGFCHKKMLPQRQYFVNHKLNGGLDRI